MNEKWNHVKSHFNFSSQVKNRNLYFIRLCKRRQRNQLFLYSQSISIIKPDPQFTQHCTLVGEICPCSISLENQNITFSSLTHGIYLNFTPWCSNAPWMRNEQQTTTRIKGRALVLSYSRNYKNLFSIIFSTFSSN